MPRTSCTIRRWEPELIVIGGETVDEAMRRTDRSETDAVCRHLLGEVTAAAIAPIDRETHR